MKKITFLSLMLLLISSLNNLNSTNLNSNTGIILGNVVNVRAKPSTKAKILFAVKENQKIKILKVLPGIKEIGKFKDKWLKIKNLAGKTGYIFGAFVFPLDYLPGKWWQSKYRYEEGGNTFLKIYKNLRFKIITETTTHDPKIKNVTTGKIIIKGRKIVLRVLQTSYTTQKKYETLFLYRYKMKNYITPEKLKIGKRNFKEIINSNFNKNSLCRYKRVYFKSQR